jgi:preprotein translocase subunit SecE
MDAKTTELTTETGGIATWPARIKEYYSELKLEMRRVSWPSWDQVRATTGVVIGSVFAFAIYFAVVDFLIGRFIAKIFETFAKH